MSILLFIPITDIMLYAAQAVLELVFVSSIPACWTFLPFLCMMITEGGRDDDDKSADTGFPEEQMENRVCKEKSQMRVSNFWIINFFLVLLLH